MFAHDNVKNEAILRGLPQLLSLTNVKNEAILRDFLNFQVDNIKNEAILRDILQTWKVDCSADGLVPMRVAIFSTPPV